MIHAHIEKDKAVPFWAAVGAPLIGVPLMVALLALAAPADKAPIDETEVGARTEQVHVKSVGQTIDQCQDEMEQPLRRG